MTKRERRAKDLLCKTGIWDRWVAQLESQGDEVRPPFDEQEAIEYWCDLAAEVLYRAADQAAQDLGHEIGEPFHCLQDVLFSKVDPPSGSAQNLWCSDEATTVKLLYDLTHPLEVLGSDLMSYDNRPGRDSAWRNLIHSVAQAARLSQHLKSAPSTSAYVILNELPGIEFGGVVGLIRALEMEIAPLLSSTPLKRVDCDARCGWNVPSALVVSS